MDSTFTVVSPKERHRYISPDCPDEVLPKVEEMVNIMEQDIKERNGQIKKFSINDFEIGCPLGRGKFGRVYLAREKKSHYMVALKILFLSELRKHRMEHQVMREVEINVHLNHPNILKMFCTFSDERRYFLLLEFAALGDVFTIQLNMPHRRFPEPQAARYIYQVASALNYIHSKNVIHRDIKPENLLLDINDNIKMADFGWSVHSIKSRRNTMCGTLDYLPPEMIKKIPYSNTVDNWCLGILCFEFLTGNPPFESSNSEQTYKKICSLDLRYPSYLPAGAKDLIQSLLKLKPTQRLSLEDVLKHEWVIEQKVLPYVKPTP